MKSLGIVGNGVGQSDVRIADDSKAARMNHRDFSLGKSKTGYSLAQSVLQQPSQGEIHSRLWPSLQAEFRRSFFMPSVFVYGTLKPQEAAYETYCAPFVVSAQPATTRGELFHLPQGYPAMTIGDHWIRGALLTFRDEAAIARIDHFEDYDPTRPPSANLYQRLRQPVFAITQQPLGTAWVYRMSPQQVCALGGTRIDNGVWSKQFFSSI